MIAIEAQTEEQTALAKEVLQVLKGKPLHVAMGALTNARDMVACAGDRLQYHRLLDNHVIDVAEANVPRRTKQASR